MPRPCDKKDSPTSPNPFIMQIVTLQPSNPDQRAIDRAASLLRQGKVIIYPTDTNSALGADSLEPKAIQKLCQLKGLNPDKQTLTLVCANIAQAAQYARIDNRAFDLMRRNLPGPFTFILPPANTLPKVLKGRKEVGVRVPDCPIALALAEELGHPIISGSIADSDPMELESQVPLMLTDASREYDDGPAQGSAIIDLTDSADPQVLREGPLPLR